jgi:hypothetical protein
VPSQGYEVASRRARSAKPIPRPTAAAEPWPDADAAPFGLVQPAARRRAAKPIGIAGL